VYSKAKGGLSSASYADVATAEGNC